MALFGMSKSGAYFCSIPVSNGLVVKTPLRTQSDKQNKAAGVVTGLQSVISMQGIIHCSVAARPTAVPILGKVCKTLVNTVFSFSFNTDNTCGNISEDDEKKQLCNLGNDFKTAIFTKEDELDPKK